MNIIEHFVNGQKFSGDSKRISKVFNPATGEQTAEVKLASIKDMDAAVEAAKTAFISWSKKPPLQRARVMFKYKELIEKNFEELTKIIVSEHGKVFDDAKGEITRGLEIVEFACGIPQLLKGEFTENVGTDVDSWSLRQPLGICAGITPFNFPAMVPMWMFPVAIACGNTFILKPSEKDPSCSIKLAELLLEAGSIVTSESLEILQKLNFKNISIINPSKSDIGPYLYNTMLVDKNQNQKDALSDIYKAVRLGEAPSSIEIAKAYFENLFFQMDQPYYRHL